MVLEAAVEFERVRRAYTCGGGWGRIIDRFRRSESSPYVQGRMAGGSVAVRSHQAHACGGGWGSDTPAYRVRRSSPYVRGRMDGRSGHPQGAPIKLIRAGEDGSPSGSGQIMSDQAHTCRGGWSLSMDSQKRSESSPYVQGRMAVEMADAEHIKSSLYVRGRMGHLGTVQQVQEARG